MPPLPNAENAVIAESKVSGYLLNPEHHNNGGKWRLFLALGYSQSNFHQFAEDIRVQHLPLDAIEEAPNNYARLFRIEGEVRGPSGTARIRTTWAIPFDTEIPHLTSAYGARQRR